MTKKGYALWLTTACDQQYFKVMATKCKYCYSYMYNILIYLATNW